MEANNYQHIIMANYKIRLAGFCEYNNELSGTAEPSIPSQGRFRSTALM